MVKTIHSCSSIVAPNNGDSRWWVKIQDEWIKIEGVQWWCNQCIEDHYYFERSS